MIGKLLGKGPLGRLRRNWEDKIKRGLKILIVGMGA
jgi:hypothetical protein